MMKVTDPMAKRESDCSTCQSCMVDTPPPSKFKRTGPVCLKMPPKSADKSQKVIESG